MTSRPVQQHPSGHDRGMPPEPPARAQAGDGPGPLGEIELGDVSLRIDDGLLMAFGPHGDPLPPAAFIAAAELQPTAEVRLADGTPVAPLRAAAVLEAQARGTLAPGADGAVAVGWLRTMLGLGPQPESAAADELRGEQELCELTAFGRELMITLPAGGPFLIAEAREPSPSSAGFVLEDGAAIAVGKLVERMRAQASPAAAGDGDLALSELGIVAAGAGILLQLPAIGAVRLVERAATAGGARVTIFRGNGEPAAVADLVAALGGAAPWADGPHPDDPSAGEASALGFELPAAISASHDGTVDLAALGAAVARSEAQLASLTVAGMPPAAALSAGLRHDDGSWSLAEADLEGLQLRLPPDAGELTLEITLRALQGMATGSIAIRRAIRDDAVAAVPPADRAQPGESQAAPAVREDAAAPAEWEESVAPAGGEASAASVVREQAAAPAVREDAAAPAEWEDAAAPVAREDAAAPVAREEAAAPVAREGEAGACGRAPVPLAIRPRLAEGVEARDLAVVIVSGLPDGARLSAGFDNGDGVWMLSPQDLVGLELLPPAGAPRELVLQVTAVAVRNREGELASADEEIRIALEAARPLPVALDPALLRQGGAALDALVIRDLPRGARLSGGTFDPAIDGWVLLPRQLAGLTVTPTAGQGPFTLTVLAVSVGTAGRPQAQVLTRLPIVPA